VTLPSFLCIGAQKAGTSWLFSQLQEHPEVWMPPVKELHFFDHLFVPENRKWALDHIHKGVTGVIKWHINNVNPPDFEWLDYLVRLGSKDVFTEQWYRDVFDRPKAVGRVCGDITPEYSIITTDGIAYIKELLGHVRIIYLIRHPVSRAQSQVRMNMQRSNISEPDMKTWLEFIHQEAVFNRGDYQTYIPRWKAIFPSDKILFIPFQNISLSPHEVMKQVEDFLGLERFAGFSGLNKPIHVSKKIDIPEDVQTAFEELFKDQVEFLKEEFDEEFFSLI